ncbi:hypothetical protein ABIE33_005905 [Ensifer sp. 4252]
MTIDLANQIRGFMMTFGLVVPTPVWLLSQSIDVGDWESRGVSIYGKRSTLLAGLGTLPELPTASLDADPGCRAVLPKALTVSTCPFRKTKTHLRQHQIPQLPHADQV